MSGVDLWEVFLGPYEAIPFFWLILGVGLGLAVYVKTESPASSFAFLLLYGTLLGALLRQGYSLLIFACAALLAYVLYRGVKG